MILFRSSVSSDWDVNVAPPKVLPDTLRALLILKTARKLGLRTLVESIRSDECYYDRAKFHNSCGEVNQRPYVTYIFHEYQVLDKRLS